MSKPAEVSLPSVYQYLDYRLFLQQWLEAKQKATPGYTLSRFARKADCSYSHARNVLHKERDLHPPQLDGFIAALRLSNEEAEFFTLLVRYQQSESLLERAQTLQAITGSQRCREARPEQTEGFLALARLSCSAVYELAFSPDFLESPTWIADQLGVSVQEAESALNDLIAVKLLIAEPGERLQPAHPVLRADPKVRFSAMQVLQAAGIEAAEPALLGPGDTNHFYGVAGAIPSSAVPKLRASANQLYNHLGAVIDGARSKLGEAGPNSPDLPGDVYQVQIQVFPVAKPVSSDASS